MACSLLSESMLCSANSFVCPRQTQLLRTQAPQRSSIPVHTVNASSVSSSVAVRGTDDGVARRQFLAAGAALVAASPLLNDEAMAGKAPKGFSACTDSVDNYAFLYPFGWQEVAVKGLDICFKDIIEPLESASVNIIKTEKTTLAELGTPDEVALALIENVLSSPRQKIKFISAKERITDGKSYYTFEFLAQAPNYTRHALGTVAVAYGKFYTLTTGANERRWGKMQDKLHSIADSFITL